MDKFKQWMYYIIIGIVSMIALCFLPMIGSTAGLGWNIPNTVVGWIVWVVVKIIVAILNVLIFHCFMMQAKVNIKDDKNYKEALEILTLNNIESNTPRGPEAWNKEQYGKKGVTIFITTALSTIALTQAMLTFDWMAMLTYLFTIILGLIFGVLQMKTAEEYWTNEFWQYAKKVEKDLELAEAEHIEQENDCTSFDSGSNILDSSVDTGNSCTNSKPLVVDRNFCDYRFLGRAVYAGNTSANSINTCN